MLISSVPYLSSWLNAHPDKESQEAPLWNSSDKYLSYAACNVLIRHLAKKAGIKKRVNPHSFRHARATHLANHLTEAQMKQYFGWVQGSDMASIYVHLSGRDVDSAIMKVYGLEKNEAKEKENVLKPRTCPRCNFINPATGRLCGQCGLALDLKTAMEIDEQTKRINSELSEALTRNPEIRKMIEIALSKKEENRDFHGLLKETALIEAQAD